MCTEQGPEQCHQMASVNQAFDDCTDANGNPQNFTTDWDYNANYTGATWDDSPPSSTDSPPSSTSPSDPSDPGPGDNGDNGGYGDDYP